MKTRPRPKHLNLIKIRMPITAIVSILHRLSGAFLFVLTPFLLYMFVSSLKSDSGFALARECMDSGLFKIFLLVLVWAVVHHLLAGIRHLVLDLDIGLSKISANFSATLVTAMALLISLLMTMWILT